MTPELRPELEPLPVRMQALPVDRGYPVPWFVEWITNEAGERCPEFRASSKHKVVTAIRKRLCWVCGDRLGANLAFVIGPMCGITRTSSEPPSHLECAEWSARNCPFLSRPHAARRDLDHPDAIPGPGIPILRNPGVTLVWVTRDFEIFDDGKGGRLIQVGDPEFVRFYASGRTATPAEIEHSIETGLPYLEATLEGPESAADLARAIKKFRQLLLA